MSEPIDIRSRSINFAGASPETPAQLTRGTVFKSRLVPQQPPPKSTIVETANLPKISTLEKIIRSPIRALQSIKRAVTDILDIPIFNNRETESASAAISEEEVNAHLQNLQGMIHNGEETQFYQFFKGLRKSGQHALAAKLAERLLENSIATIKNIPFTTTTAGEEERRLEATTITQYRFVVQQLQRVYPEIGQNFLPYDLKQYKTEPDFNVNYLSPAGVKAIVAQLRSDGSLNCNCIVCDSEKDFEHQIRKQLKKMESAEGVSKCAFIVYNKTAHHFTPVYIEKKGDRYEAVVTDSIGREAKEADQFDLTDTITAPINAVLSAGLQKALPSKNWHIYSYMGKYRQRDVVNCPIFSIRDVVKLAHSSEALMAWIRGQPRLQGSSDRISYIEELPVELMKTTQGTKRMADRASRTQEGDPQVQLRSRETTTPLSTYLKDRTVSLYRKDGVIIKTNAKAPLTFMKYEKLVISQVISSLIRRSR